MSLGYSPSQLLVVAWSITPSLVNYSLGVFCSILLSDEGFAIYSFILSWVLVFHGLGLALIMEPFLTTNRSGQCRLPSCGWINIVVAIVGAVAFSVAAEMASLSVGWATYLMTALWIYFLNEIVRVRKNAYLGLRHRVLPLSLALSCLPLAFFVFADVGGGSEVWVAVAVAAFINGMGLIPFVSSDSPFGRASIKSILLHVGACGPYLAAAVAAHLALTLPLLLGFFLTDVKDYGHVRMLILCCQPSVLLTAAFLNLTHGRMLVEKPVERQSPSIEAGILVITGCALVGLSTAILAIFSVVFDRLIFDAWSLIFCGVFSLTQGVIALYSVIIRFDANRYGLFQVYAWAAALSNVAMLAVMLLMEKGYADSLMLASAISAFVFTVYSKYKFRRHAAEISAQ